MDPQRVCRTICRQSQSNFVKTFFFLPRHRRRGFEAFYAFCRLVDDAVDEADTPEQARQDLKTWRVALERIHIGEASHPVAQALLPVIRRFDIPLTLLEEIINGCQMDLEQSSYQSFQDLQEYCFRVASCVGLVSLHLFEVEMSDRTRQAAIDLGMAVQLTNILRDLRSDYERGRIYLPQEDLRLFNVNPENFKKSVQELQETSALIELIKFEMTRARSYYQKAWQGFPADRHSRRPLLVALLMGRIYEKLLDKLAADPIRIFQEKVALNSLQKFRVAQRVLKEAYSPS